MVTFRQTSSQWSLIYVPQQAAYATEEPADPGAPSSSSSLPVNLLIYGRVWFLSSLFTASEKEISTGGMRKFVTETLSGVMMNKSQSAEIRQAVCLWAQEEVEVRRRLFRKLLHLWSLQTQAEMSNFQSCTCEAELQLSTSDFCIVVWWLFSPETFLRRVNSNILTEAYFFCLWANFHLSLSFGFFAPLNIYFFLYHICFKGLHQSRSFESSAVAKAKKKEIIKKNTCQPLKCITAHVVLLHLTHETTKSASSSSGSCSEQT